EVLVGDVAVVLAGADRRGGDVVGLEEVQEVVPVERAVRVEQPLLGEVDAVARRQAADEVRRGGALEVDVQLGLGDGGDVGGGHRRTSATTGRSPGAVAPTAI